MAEGRSSSERALFPDEAEIDRLIVGPGSITWELSSDVRLFLAPLYALLLQVAHPTVGAGVRDYSDFEHRPWERLLRTLDYLVLLQYGGREAAAVGRRLRELHGHMKGTRADGRPYHALEPGAYAWVHATLLETYVRAHEHFARPMTRAQVERFYAEYTGLGRLVGVRQGDLPETWDGFRAYFEYMVGQELGHNETVDRVLAAARRPAPPEVPPMPSILWSALRRPAASLSYLGGVGLLPGALRERLRIRWTRREEREFRALAAGSRALEPVLPAAMRALGPSQLRWRRRAIARGPFGHLS
ncbi:MAG: DUF2236 domain-containing protein [Solirubrobacterales bacterium]|nr:DUF2236 domain-containing protein [Solirubrobacterales bacterium]MBV9165084.1 DUF2236 domain-containing protein [Solirubrobacterales bacterium]MBV9535257.1 DUF2236 domain-containing protein [Solirubrobacterales bacterium]